MITYIEYGDIFEIDNVHNYAHGCNCSGAMGKGIALQFKEKFPNMYAIYKQLCKDGLFKPGDIFPFNYNNTSYVFNLGTQATWKTKATLESIEKSFHQMLLFASKNNISKIAMPKIGAGLGGLDWKNVKTIINNIANSYPNIDIFIVENYLKK